MKASYTGVQVVFMSGHTLTTSHQATLKILPKQGSGSDQQIQLFEQFHCYCQHCSSVLIGQDTQHITSDLTLDNMLDACMLSIVQVFLFITCHRDYSPPLKKLFFFLSPQTVGAIFVKATSTVSFYVPKIKQLWKPQCLSILIICICSTQLSTLALPACKQPVQKYITKNKA